MKIKNLISSVLSILMIATAFGTINLTALAAPEGFELFSKTQGADLYVNKETGEIVFALGEELLFQEVEETTEASEDEAFDFETYYTAEYSCPQEYMSKTMTYLYDKGDYGLFADQHTGAMAFVRKSTGEILFTNPYDIGSTQANTATKNELLSQFTFTYTKSGTAQSYSTFNEAAKNGQINIKRIRGGVRVEYTVGRQEARVLVPKRIEKERFETEILSKITMENAPPGKTEAGVNKDYQWAKAYYKLMDKDTATSQEQYNNLILKYPIAKKYAFYIFDTAAGTRETYQMESIIKQYTDYTYEMLQEDHALVEYEGNEISPPVFKMALEYYLDDNGIKIRVPAKSISYDRNTYTITELKILPFLGAGSYTVDEKSGETLENGYTFYPDGSGTIVRFDDIEGTSKVISAKVYGQDYAYHATSGQNKETMRIPAFGVKRDTQYQVVTGTETITTEKEVNGTFSTDTVIVNLGEKYDVSTAFLAYMEEGDAMVTISTSHGGISHKYNSTYVTVTPELSDTYELAGISTDGSAKWTVEANRAYTGNYTFRIFMLSGEDADYTGMAGALRNYFIDNGVLTPIDEQDENIPLLLENFGSVKTTQKVLGIPVKENTPLTTFEQSKTMIDELKSLGVSNIDLKLTGWYNGGLEHTVPSKLKIQKSIGGSDGLKDLVQYAKDNGVSLYPDFDFTYVSKDASFDGFNYKDDAVRTIDNKAASHRVYSALYQGFENDDLLIVSPEKMLDLYEDVMKKYSKYEVGGLSAATLGSDLSSDHNEDAELTREEAKETIVELLSQMSEENGKLLVSGGNAYTYAYADVITDLPLDSSRNVYASEAVPFLGMLLHGCVEYTGTAINLDGDFDYSVLKCIENGASPYFILSYTDDTVDNTSELKKFEQFSKYYSIKYGIWKNDLVTTYTKLNGALKDVMTSAITEHEYVDDKVVKVTYSDGNTEKTFILNYNNETYNYGGADIEALGFIVEQ